MSKKKHKPQLDQEETDLLSALDNGEMVLRKPSANELEKVKTIAVSTFKKDRRITIRLYEHDYQGIQKKAMEMGMPYQTLISGVIHRYIEGDLVEK